MAFTIPPEGAKITMTNGMPVVPDNPIVLFIEGDGIGPDIWAASRKVFDAAVTKAYGGTRKVAWMEVFAGEKAHAETGEWLPSQTIDAIREYAVAIKGPLSTPVGGGIRSLNVTIRQLLDLYACVRPVRYFDGVPSPVKEPHKLDVIIFRENTEDVYAGIEWQSGSPEARRVIDFINTEMDKNISSTSGIGIKPISPEGTERLVRSAINYALAKKKKSVTLVHKGNIMKFTEGAFKQWGYELAAREYPDSVITEEQMWAENLTTVPEGKLLLKNRIADAMFQQVLLRPNEYDVLATPNLNGDYLSDACAAQVGGLGMAPGANIGDHCAVFEATHGTAPKYTGLDRVNPGSLILSGAMMFEYMGWDEVSETICKGIEAAIAGRRVTYDLARQMDGATEVKCSEFADEIVANM